MTASTPGKRRKRARFVELGSRRPFGCLAGRDHRVRSDRDPEEREEPWRRAPRAAREVGASLGDGPPGKDHLVNPVATRLQAVLTSLINEAIQGPLSERRCFLGDHCVRTTAQGRASVQEPSAYRLVR